MDNPKVFISYAHEDKERFVMNFASKLRKNGIDAWIDEWEMEPGDSLVRRIFDDGINKCDAFLIILSKNSVDKKWVREELDSAVVQRIEKEIDLIPVLIDSHVEIPVPINHIKRVKIDNLDDYDYELQTLLMKLYGISKKPVLGQKPNFVVDYELPGYSKLDAIVLKNIGDLSIEKEDFNYIISGDDLLKNIIDIDLNEKSILESLKILDNDNLIKMTITSGSISNYPIKLSSKGFGIYAKYFISDFSDIELKVLSSICNDKLRLNMEISSCNEIPIGVVDLLLEMYASLGYLEFAGHMGGYKMIDEITITGKRYFENKLS